MPDNVLTNVELADLRGALTSWRPDTASVYRKPASSQDAYGGHGTTSAFALVSSANAVSIESSPSNEQERALMGIIGQVQVFYVTFDYNSDVRVDDKLVITSQGNIELRVRAVVAPESWELERRVAATRLGA